MENGDGTNFVEKRAVGVEASDSQVARVVPDGSKDSEGDEIFEETEMEKLDSADALLNENQTAEKIETLGVSPGVEQNISEQNDPDDFKEAAASPIEEQTHDFENFGVVEVASETVNGDEVSGSEKSELPDDGVNEVKKVSHSDAAPETEVLNNGDGVDRQSEIDVQNKGNSDGTKAAENSVNGDFDKQETVSNKKLETQDANTLEGLLTDSHPDITSGVGVSHPAENNMEENEKSTFPHTHQHKNGELEDALALPCDHRADNSEELKGNLVNQNTELKYSDSRELSEESSVTRHPMHQDNRVEGQIDTPVSFNPQAQDGRSPKLKDLVTSESESHGNSNIQEDGANTFFQDKIPAPLKENYTVEKHEKIIASSSDLEGDKDADASIEVSDGIPLTEKQAVKDEEVNHSALESKEQKTQPAAGIPSLPEKSVNSTSNPARPAGLGRAAPLLEPAARVMQQPRANGNVSPMQNQLVEDPTNGEAEENDETREKLQMIRVKFLRLAHRLGQTPHNVVVAQVLYRLGLAEQLRGRNGGRVAAFSFDRASALAEQLEAAGQEALDFSCTIMVLGKTGVGKSATINSIFDEIKFDTDAFQTGTKTVQDVVGTVQGIKVRVIDTPGLLPSWSDQRQNENILHSVKHFIKKTPPDIVLYLDRLDMQSRDFGDMPLLRTITEIFGPSIWFNAIVVLTHAASAPPEGQNGIATGYDMFVTQRSHVVQQAIRQAAGDMRLMNPVSLVENHSACRTNRAGQRVLPNGQVWKPHLLLLSFASKILAEANTLLKLQDNPPGKPFAARARAPPLPFLLSSLLQSRSPVKLPSEQFGDDDDALNDDLDESSDSDDDSEYDELPPFKPLTKAQIAKLSKAQKKAYYDELEYREKLFMKKQLKEEKKRRRMMKKMEATTKELPGDYNDNIEEEAGGAASVPVPMPDLALPASFDSDNPTHRYRCLDSMNQWLVRPVLDPNGWDHDVGYEGINAERLFVIKDSIPISFSGQVTKDKKDTNLVMELASSIKHGEGKLTSLGFDMQSIGKDIAYTVRSDTRFSNYRRNKATAGLSATLLGDILTAGVKVEDKFIVNKQGQLVVSGGAIVGRGDIAYGGSLEATLRDKDHPLGRFLSTFGLSVMDWHGDLAIGWNGHIQIPVGRFTNLIGRVNLNNRGSGQVSIRLNSSEQLQIALVSLLPIVRKVLAKSQRVQYGQ